MKIRVSTNCPIVFSLDIFGDRWSLVILRDILFIGKSHFTELLGSDEKIASNILSSRLERLTRAGLLIREDDLHNKSAAVYRPTKKALDLLPTLLTLIQWGVTYNPSIDTNSSIIKEALHNPEELRAKIIARNFNLSPAKSKE